MLAAVPNAKEKLDYYYKINSETSYKRQSSVKPIRPKRSQEPNSEDISIPYKDVIDSDIDSDISDSDSSSSSSSSSESDSDSDSNNSDSDKDTKGIFIVILNLWLCY